MNGYHFSERVRQALAFAREEAVRLHHEYVGTEHLLLGLTRQDDSVALSVLRNRSIDVDAVRRNVEETVKPGRVDSSGRQDLPYTSRAKKILELAMSEARELGHNHVGTEHLLMGLLREEKGIAAQVLTHSGLTIDNARTELLSVVAERPESSKSTVPTRVHRDGNRFLVDRDGTRFFLTV